MNFIVPTLVKQANDVTKISVHGHVSCSHIGLGDTAVIVLI